MVSQKTSFSRPNRKKLIFVGGPVAVILIAGLITGAIVVFHKNPSTGALDAEHDYQKKAATIDNGGNPTDSTSSKSTPAGSYTAPSNDSGITLTASQSGSSVIIKTQLAGYSDGSCTLEVTNGPKTASQTADVIYAPNFSTCAGFSVPISQLDTGHWTIMLSVVSGGQTTGKSITYEVH